MTEINMNQNQNILPYLTSKGEIQGFPPHNVENNGQ